MATLTRRKIIKEDISFDSAGTDATDTITRPNGSTTTGKRVNAGDLPLKAATQTQTGQANVDAAIAAIKQTQDDTTTKDGDTTQKGLVQLATAAETQAGAIATKANTPAGLAALTATEARKGLIERATIAEAEAGTDTERAVTPAGVAAAVDARATSQDWGSRIEVCPNWVTDSSDTTLTINTPCKMFDETDEYFFKLDSAITKDLQAFWVKGNNNGGMANGITFPMTYDRAWVFMIYNKDTGEVDAIIDDNPTGAKILATTGTDWVKRLVGLVNINGTSLGISSNVVKLGCCLRNNWSLAHSSIGGSNAFWALGSHTFSTDLVSVEDVTGFIGTNYKAVRGIMYVANLAASDQVEIWEKIGDGNAGSDWWTSLGSLGDVETRLPFISNSNLGEFRLQLWGSLGATKIANFYINAIDVFSR